MKQEDARAQIASSVSALASTTDLSLSPTTPDRLADLLIWLTPAAARLNLTRYSDPVTLARQLVFPLFPALSASVRPHLLSPALDFGAGSGAVGLSLALLAPDLQVVLADRRKRVIQFAELAIGRHGLANCSALLVDLHSPPDPLAHAFGSVLIRAFGPVSEALGAASRWLRPDGSLLLWHQPPAPSAPDGLGFVLSRETPVDALSLTVYQRH